MRPWLLLSALVAFAAAAPGAARTILVCAASVMLESLPYLAASVALATLVGARGHRYAAYAGCGCGNGPAARSLPAAFATAAIFGAPAAIARVAAASLIARFTGRDEHHHDATLLDELLRLAPAALLAGAIAAFVPESSIASLPSAAAFAAGATIGAAASPCALGGVALAASFHANAPWAAIGVLCTAGMFDLRLMRHGRSGDDRTAYAVLAFACALVAWEHGAALVHPRMTLPLAATSLFCAAKAVRSQTASRIALGLACALLGAIVVGAPAPSYASTETTLADAFAGEHVTFTGFSVAEHGRYALVRYAVTCCRADAAPVTLALDRPVAAGRWLRADGTLRERNGRIALRAERIEWIAAPSDPFVYL